MKKLISTILAILLIITCSTFALVGCTTNPLVGNRFETAPIKFESNYFGDNKEYNAEGVSFTKDTITEYNVYAKTGEHDVEYTSTYIFDKETGIITLGKTSSHWGNYLKYINSKILCYPYILEIEDLEKYKPYQEFPLIVK